MPSTSTGIGLIDNLASSRPCLVKGKPGSSIQTFFCSRPRTRSASPRPLLKPPVMMICDGAHSIPAPARDMPQCRASIPARRGDPDKWPVRWFPRAPPACASSRRAWRKGLVSGHTHLENGRSRSELLVHLHERAGWGAASCRGVKAGRSATRVPVARDATISCAEESFRRPIARCRAPRPAEPPNPAMRADELPEPARRSRWQLRYLCGFVPPMASSQIDRAPAAAV